MNMKYNNEEMSNGQYQAKCTFKRVIPMVAGMLENITIRSINDVLKDEIFTVIDNDKCTKEFILVKPTYSPPFLAIYTNECNLPIDQKKDAISYTGNIMGLICH